MTNGHAIVYYGGFAGVWERMLESEKNVLQSVERLRVTMRKRITRSISWRCNPCRIPVILAWASYGEAVVRRDSHPNVVLFLGVMPAQIQRPSLPLNLPNEKTLRFL